MIYRNIRFFFSVFILLLVIRNVSGQVGVPAGINYQAVARDNYGKELANTDIDVRFSIIAKNPLGTVVYQELHSDVITSKYGVFSLIIGKGVPTGGNCNCLAEVSWGDSFHYLKVEVKFGSSFIDMGTMQFMAVPYALFASKSLEPGPVGPKGNPGIQGPAGSKGDPGDPATNDQTLSIVNIDGSDYLAISGGNQVKISNIEKDGDPTNEIQDLTLNSDKLRITNKANANELDLSQYRQSLTYDPVSRILGINGSSSMVNLSELKYDNDTSSVNEIQRLSLASDNLSISGSNSVSLAGYKNTDNQMLNYSETSNSKTLQISGGNSVTLENMVAFKAKNTTSDPASSMSYTTMTYDAIDYNIGGYLNEATGIFTAPKDGIYTFNVTYFGDGIGGSRELAIYVNSVLNYKLAIDIGAGSTIPVHSVTMKLSAANTVSIIIYTGVATQTGTGSFSGYKVY